jgi:hypothetical protein
VHQLQPFRPYFYVQRGHTGEVVARSVEAGYETTLDWVACGMEDNRNGCGRGLGSARGEVSADSDDHGDRTPNELVRQRR